MPPAPPFFRRFQTSMLLHGLWTRLDAVKELAGEIESSIESRLREIDERGNSLSEIEDGDYRDHLSDRLGDEHHVVSNEWTAVTRESLLLTLCSSFEHALVHLADSYAKSMNCPFGVTDLNGRGISRCRIMFVRLGLPESTFGAAWKRLDSVFEIRNKFAHAGGLPMIQS